MDNENENTQIEWYGYENILAEESHYENGNLKSTKRYFRTGIISENICLEIDDDKYAAKNFYDTGVIKQEFFHNKNGQKNGPLLEYYRSGMLFQTVFYKDNKKNGITKSYFSNGAISAITHYKNDEVCGTHKAYYPTGVLGYDIFCKSGRNKSKENRMNGTENHYYNNGVLYYKAVQDKEKIEFYPNGAIQIILSMKLPATKEVTMTFARNGILTLFGSKPLFYNECSRITNAA